MCDFSLQAVKSRPAKVADKLTTKNFGYGTTGFCASEDSSVAVCIMPGTELAFDEPVQHKWLYRLALGWPKQHTTAIFRQINRETERMHHDCLEFPDGSTIMLTLLTEDQRATVLQLPAAPKTDAEREAQTRVAVTA